MSKFDTNAVLAEFGLDKVHSGTYSDAHGWGPTEGRTNIEHICTADGEHTGTIAGSNAEDYEKIISAAVEAQKEWALVPPPRRGELVLRIGQLISENKVVKSIDKRKSYFQIAD